MFERSERKKETDIKHPNVSGVTRWPEAKLPKSCLRLLVRSLRIAVSGPTVCSDLQSDWVPWHRCPARPADEDREAKLPRSKWDEADINPPPPHPLGGTPVMDDLCLQQASFPRSRPLRTYPYNGIRRSVKETCAAAPVISCFTDQSLFRCLWGSSEMSPAAAWEPRVWLQLFSVKYQIHLSDSGFGRREEPLVLPRDGCCVYDLFSASAAIVLLRYTVSVAPSVTQICSAPSSAPQASNCRQTAGCYQGDQREEEAISASLCVAFGSHLYGSSKHPCGGLAHVCHRVWEAWISAVPYFPNAPSRLTLACSALYNQKEQTFTGDWNTTQMWPFWIRTACLVTQELTDLRHSSCVTSWFLFSKMSRICSAFGNLCNFLSILITFV